MLVFSCFSLPPHRDQHSRTLSDLVALRHFLFFSLRGLEGVDGGGEGGRAASVSVVQPWDDDLPFRRDDFVRVISSCLKGLGYE